MIRRLSGIALALTSCLSTIGAAAPTIAPAGLAQSYAHFGFDLLRALRTEQPGRNVFISPASVAVALAMAANGASVGTRTAILSTLHVGGLPLATFNAENRAFATQIAQTRAVHISMANALWVQTGFTVRPSFVADVRENFGAQAANLDFSNPRSVDTVNEWTNQHTDGMIPKALDVIDPQTVMMLANAIAFKGAWTTPFAPSATAIHTFSSAGRPSMVHMMSHTASYSYAAGNGMQTIELPYADGSFAMYVVLPKDDATLDRFVRDLTPASLDALTTSLRSQPGTIQLPRFTLSYNVDLNFALEKLGMGVAFSSVANFSNIHAIPPTIAISDVKHVTFLQVDEAGTKAAAVTTIGFRTLAIRQTQPPFTMTVDRPFVVAIEDTRSKQLLFLGTIVRP